ncbi:MAG: hypothetical protein PVG39_20760 [Desulfobacteraceae bacterium]|jgi:hypothetical protein
MYRIKLYILALLSAASILLINTQSSFAFTFVVDDESSLVTGINGLTVGDDIYNTTFVEGTALDLYYDGENWNFDFTDKETALLAAESLREAIESVEAYDYYPSLYLYGLQGSSNGTDMVTPYVHAGYRDWIYCTTFHNEHNISVYEMYDSVGSKMVNEGDDSNEMRAGYFPWVFVSWEEQSSAVPIPGAVWLLGSGLLGLIGIRKRRDK